MTKRTKVKLLTTVLGVVTCLMLITACSSNPGSGSETAEEGQFKTLKVGTHAASYPYGLKNSSNELEGYDIEVTEAVAGKLGYKVEWTITDFTGLMGQLDIGKIATVAEHVAITDERKEKYLFADPYIYSDIRLIVPEDNTAIQTLDDLQGKSIAVSMGSFYESIVKEYNATHTANPVKIVPYEEIGGIMNDVALGRVDATINDKVSGASKIEQSGLALKVTDTNISKFEHSFPFARNEQNEQLVQDFNKALNELREDGTLKKISEKWFNEDVTQK